MPNFEELKKRQEKIRNFSIIAKLVDNQHNDEHAHGLLHLHV